VLTAGGEIVALDAKVILDESAFFVIPSSSGSGGPGGGPAGADGAGAGPGFIRLAGSVGIVATGRGW